LIPILRVFKFTWRDEPVLGTLVSIVVAQCVLMIGSLDAIAPLLTLFFLLTYATTNFATFVHTIAGHPNFRPRFRFFSWHTALLGGIICVGLMFYLQWQVTILVLCIFIGVVGYIGWRGEATDEDWGRIGQSLIFHQVRKYLLRLDSQGEHIKFWRAQILFLMHNPTGKCNVLEFVNNLKKGGLFIIGDVVSTGIPGMEGNGAGGLPLGDSNLFAKVHERRQDWHRLIADTNIKAFVELVLAPSLRLGVANLMLAGGLGGMRPNTVVLNFFQGAPPDSQLPRLNSVWDGKKYRPSQACTEWPSTTPQLSAKNDVEPLDYVQVLRDCVANSRNIALLRHFEQLDKEAISQRLSASKPTDARILLSQDQGEFDPAASVAGLVKGRVRIDIWDMPWASDTQSFELAMQLAWMLYREDFWHRNAYLRVLSFVENDDEALLNTRKKYASLYHRVVRVLRIPATIQVFILADELEEDFHEAHCKASQAPDFQVGSSQLLDTMDPWQRYEMICKLIKAQSADTAVTMLPIPPMPQGVICTNDAADYISQLRAISDGLGPTVMVQAVQKVVSEDL